MLQALFKGLSVEYLGLHESNVSHHDGFATISLSLSVNVYMFISLISPISLGTPRASATFHPLHCLDPLGPHTRFVLSVTDSSRWWLVLVL